jgi:two-component system chemotaxis sensor kinase CheA
VNGLNERLLAAFRIEHKDHLEAARAMLDACEAAGWIGQAPDLVELHRRLHSLKGAARAVDMRPVEALAHALEGLIDDFTAGRLTIDRKFARTIRDALNAIEDWVDAAMARRSPPAIDEIIRVVEASREGAHAPSTTTFERGEAIDGTGDEGDAAAAPTMPQELLRVDARKFERLMQSSAEILSAAQEQDALLSEIQSVRSQIDRLCREWASISRRERAPAGEVIRGVEASLPGRGATVRLEQVAQVLSKGAARQRAYAQRMRRLGRSLQSQIHFLRMVSAESVFGGARKIIRDIARDEGKQAAVIVRGLDTLADRFVLLSLKDPVLHILRNAIHHGIETPTERAANGKPDEGLVILEVSSRGREISIRIEDDGRGVDRGKVEAAARRKGVAAGAVSTSDEALTSLLCLPGLTTAETVTEVAGRGMGLSIVKEAVARLGGVLSISARGPCGVVVQIAAPASLLSKRFVFIAAADARFCVPAGRVKRMHRTADGRARIETLEGRPHLILGDSPPMALAPLAFLLRLDETKCGENLKGSTIIELAGVDLRFGIIVDVVLGVWDGLVRDLGLDSASGDMFAGGVALEDGVIAPVLDVAALVRTYRQTEGCISLSPEGGERENRLRSILVVDDSITTRTLEKSVLEASGYQVRLSVDGADALRELRQRPADLVISDIEMPNLDGFALVKAMKQDEALARIPIILVTSRNDDADRRRGLETGADAYVVKQRFDQAELLSIIDRLL